MDRLDLECALAIADGGSVTAAATHLHLSQPAVTKRLARLERHLEVRLFHRTSIGMRPTVAGETLLEFAAGVIAGFDRTERVVRARHAGSPQFKVACPYPTAERVLAPFIASSNAGIADLVVTPADEVDHALAWDADLAVCTVIPPATRHRLVLASIPITAQRHTVPATQRAHINLEDLVGHALLVPRTGVGTTVVSAATEVRELSFRHVASGSIAQALAAAGQGIALVTEPPLFGLDVTTVHARSAPLTIPLYASWAQNHPAHAEIRELADRLKAWLLAIPTFEEHVASRNGAIWGA